MRENRDDDPRGIETAPPPLHSARMLLCSSALLPSASSSSSSSSPFLSSSPKDSQSSFPSSRWAFIGFWGSVELSNQITKHAGSARRIAWFVRASSTADARDEVDCGVMT